MVIKEWITMDDALSDPWEAQRAALGALPSDPAGVIQYVASRAVAAHPDIERLSESG